MAGYPWMLGSIAGPGQLDLQLARANCRCRAIHSQANCRCQANYSWPGPSPVGLGRQLAPNTAADHFSAFRSRIPSPLHTSHTVPNLLLPIPPEKGKEKTFPSRRGSTPPSLHPGSQPPTASRPPPRPPPPSPGSLAISCSGGADALRSLRGGEGDLHPLTTRRTSLFAERTLAWKRCGLR